MAHQATWFKERDMHPAPDDLWVRKNIVGLAIAENEEDLALVTDYLVLFCHVEALEGGDGDPIGKFINQIFFVFNILITICFFSR